MTAKPGQLPFVEWIDIGPSHFLNNGPVLRLTPGVFHHVRLFHKPFRFWRQVQLNGRVRIITSKEARELRTGVSCRYAINVIDRRDGRIRVLEGPEDLFVELRRCHEMIGVDLGGADSFDVAIEVTREGIPKKYHVSFDADRGTPFTLAEKEMLRRERLDLTSLFGPSINS